VLNVTENNNKLKVAVITGSSKGIGKAISMEFAKSGYCVVLNARDEDELRTAAEDISKLVETTAENNNTVAYMAGDISQKKTAYL
jgi:3-oxoacyl-[acyl-carrier protein] reductase